jgi:predicted O-methyltransferase YrrM
MKQPIQRREFLRTAGAAGAAGWLSGLGTALGAENADSPQPAAASTPPQSAAVMAQLEALAREFITIPKEEGRLLNLLIKLTRARRVLEIGTGYGYTTIWLALALEETDGELTTVEIVSERVELAKKQVAKAGLTHRVNFKQGDAHAIVPTLAGPFDVAYLDADKDRQVDYFNKLFPAKLPPGSLLIAHNATLRADAMKEYLELVRQHPAFDTLNVSAVPEDALALSYRRRARR